MLKQSAKSNLALIHNDDMMTRLRASLYI